MSICWSSDFSNDTLSISLKVNEARPSFPAILEALFGQQFSLWREIFFWHIFPLTPDKQAKFFSLSKCSQQTGYSCIKQVHNTWSSCLFDVSCWCVSRTGNFSFIFWEMCPDRTLWCLQISFSEKNTQSWSRSRFVHTDNLPRSVS